MLSQHQQPFSSIGFVLLLSVAVFGCFFLFKISSPQCSHIFIDLGSNSGDTIQKFVFPDDPKHQHSFLSQWVRKHQWKAKDFCIYGFEGNPRFSKELEKLQNSIKNTVKSIRIFTETVATTTNGPVTFYLDELSYEHNYWGSSLVPSHRDVWMSGKKSIISYGIDFSSFLAQLLSCSFHSCSRAKQGKTVIVQMDVEGEEYEILRQLLVRDMICGVIDYLFVEFHSHAFRLDDNTTVVGAPPLEFESCFHWLVRHPNCKTVAVTDGLVDDYQNVEG
eukprot:jgi/Galph1/479/GphlegSOOS_G5246.1